MTASHLNQPRDRRCRRFIAGLAAGLSWCAFTAPPALAAVGEVIVVFKTHFDIGYTDMASNVVQRYRTTMIDDALKVVDQNHDLPSEQQFVWTLPGWPLVKILEDWPGQTPERQRRVREAFKQGRFVTHALPFTTHTELLELEDLVRGLGYASRLSREAGLPLPRDAKMTDVPCHSWILPTLLRHAGVDFLHLGCNAASSSPRVPVLFWWEGPDGSRLLTMYTAESYGTGLVPPADWPYRTWLALIHTGDNHGPPRPEEVKKLLDEAKVKLPGVKVRIGRLSDFADAILAETGDSEGGVPRRPDTVEAGARGTRPSGRPVIPVVRGDMPDTWIYGPMSDPLGATLARTFRPQIAMTESLNTLLPLWGVKTLRCDDEVAKARIEDAYENSLLYGEHTWGGALYWVTPYGSGMKWSYGDKWEEDRKAGRFERIESSWEEHTAYIREVVGLVGDSSRQMLQQLARTISVPGHRIVVFNPLPWKRDGIVELETPHPFRRQPPDWTWVPPRALRPVDGGDAVPVSDGSTSVARQMKLSFTARDVPPLGYRTYVVAEPPPGGSTPAGLSCDPVRGVVETPHFRAEFDTNRCVLISLVDKATGRELVNRDAVHGFGEFVYERFTSNQVAAFVQAYVKINADWATNELGKPMLPSSDPNPVQVQFKPRGLEFTQTAARLDVGGWNLGQHSLLGIIMTRYTFYADQQFVDIQLVASKPADPWPEASWLALPFKFDQPRFQLGRLGSVIDPAKEIVAGANRHLFALNTGLTITDATGFGVGLCSDDRPLVSLGEPGCWKYSVEDFPRAATVYINLFNNQWTTNFRLWNEGIVSANVRIWPIEKGTCSEAALITPSLETRFPLQSAVANGPAGSLPTTAMGLELSRRGFQVTAFGANPDGSGTVLRLWELAGQSGDCQVTLPSGMNVARVQPVDLRGRPTGAAIPVNDGRFTGPLQAFAPASFVLER
jgi:hypothetical protein